MFADAVVHGTAVSDHGAILIILAVAVGAFACVLRWLNRRR